MIAAIKDQTIKEGYWINELMSLAIEPRRKNELNNIAELEALANNIKQVYYQDYKTALASGWRGRVVPSDPNNIKIRILIVDDEPDILFGLNAFFKRLGHYVKTFDKLEQLLERLASPDVHYDLVVADYRMPGGISGLDIAKQVKERTGKKQRSF